VVATTVTKSATVPLLVNMVPLSSQPPSTFTALVRSEAASDPAFGSVIAKAPILSPRSAGLSQRSRSAGLPQRYSVCVAVEPCMQTPAAKPIEPRASSSHSTVKQVYGDWRPLPPTDSGYIVP